MSGGEVLTGATRIARAPQERLRADDLFRIVEPREPRLSPDGQTIMYLRVGPDIMTDRVRSALHVVGRDGSDDRRLDAVGDALFARWAADATIVVVVAAAAGARVLRLTLAGDKEVVGDLPFAPSRIELDRDGRRMAMLMTVEWPRHEVAMPARPDGADWSPRARHVDRTVWQLDGVGELDGAEQLFVMDLADGSLRQLTTDLPAAPLFAGGIAWSADGARLFFSANRRDDRQWDTDIHALDLASGRVERLTGGAGSDIDPKISPDGAWIAYRGFDDRGQFHHAPDLRVMRSDGSDRRILLDIAQNIGSHAWRADGDGIVFSYVRDGALHLASVTLSGTVTELAGELAPDGRFDVEPYISGGAEFDVDAHGIVAIVAPPGRSGQVVHIAADGTATPLTRLNEWLSGIAIGRTERLDVAGADGTPIQAWLIYPPGYDPRSPCPLILDIHGGPNLAYGAHFSFRFQRYAAEGYLVLLVNYRGSAGADMAFYETPSSFPVAEFDDLMAGVDAAIAHACVDPARLFVTGLSAGGILTAWTIGKTTRFAAAAVHSPIVNWISHTLTCDLYSSYADRSFAVRPWDDPMAYWHRSPLSLVANVVTPALVIHGELDSRTPRSEGVQFYHALKLLGVPTALVLLPGSFHIPTRPTQWIEEQHYILDWFADHSPPHLIGHAS